MASQYPGSLDTTTTLPTRVTNDSIPASDNNDKNTAIIALETKVGTGASDAASAANLSILSKKTDGTTGYQSATGLGLPTATQTMGTVVHTTNASAARPSGFGSITWIGSVAPTNAITNDIWYDTTT